MHKPLCSSAPAEVKAVAVLECDGILLKRPQPTLLRHISHQTCNKSVKTLQANHNWSLKVYLAVLAVMKAVLYHNAVLSCMFHSSKSTECGCLGIQALCCGFF